MRLWRLTAFSLDGDEIFSLLLARSDWHALFASATQDAIHPPLLYVLLKGWIWIGGESLFWLRLFPVVASVLCLIPFFFLCGNLGVPPGARNLALAIASVHPYAVFYSQHMRMYCLLMLLGLVSAWLFQLYLEQPSLRNLSALTAANVFLVYTHYYGWLIVGLECLYLIWRRHRVSPFIYSTALVIALFSPWAWFAGQTLHNRGLAVNLGWLVRPTVTDMLWFFVDLTGSAEFPRLGVRGAVIVLALLVITYRRYQDLGAHWLMLLWIAPAPIAFLASQWLPQSIWGHRHLVFTLWPFLIVFADSVYRLRTPFRLAVMALIAVWGAYAIAFHPTDDRKVPYDSFTLDLLNQESSGDARIPLFTVDPYLHYPLWFYMDCLKTGHLGPFGPHLDSHADVAALTATAARFDIIKATGVDAAQGRHFWIGYSDSAWNEPRTPKQMLEQRGCSTGRDITARDRFLSVTLFPVDCP